MTTTTRRGPAAVLSTPEVKALLATFASETNSVEVRNKALVTFLWRTGLRIGEALALTLSDCSLQSETPTVRVRNGKNGTQLTAGLHPEALLALRQWLVLRPGAAEHLWCTTRAPFARLDDSYVRAMLRRHGARAGIPRCHPHAFRATLATELVREGVPLPVVRDVLGHSGIAVTDAYLRRVFPELAIEALIARA